MRARSPQLKGLVRDRLWSQIWPLLPSKEWIRPVIDSTFPLAEAARAHRRMETGEHIGKIVLTTSAR
jgi:NADPH2:quinone reductase